MVCPSSPTGRKGGRDANSAPKTPLLPTPAILRDFGNLQIQKTFTKMNYKLMNQI